MSKLILVFSRMYEIISGENFDFLLIPAISHGRILIDYKWRSNLKDLQITLLSRPRSGEEKYG
jgi:hypothetical protein